MPYVPRHDHVTCPKKEPIHSMEQGVCKEKQIDVLELGL